MRNQILLFCMVGICFIAVSCTGDFLDTAPENQTGSAIVFEKTEYADMAVNGIAKLMNTPFFYPDKNTPKTAEFNGEGAIKMINGNWMGNHFVCSNRDGYGVLYKGTNYMSNTSSVYCFYPWWYYYMIIGNANTIVTHIALAEGVETDRQRILAQALTFRAYAYTMLSQIYCKRWMDSDEGNADGVVLRLTDSYEALKLCTLKQLYKQIYDDLDEAIRLFKLSGFVREGNNHLPDIHVAYAIYARAALVRQDYKTAAAMAVAAREGFPLMTNAEYSQGFNVPVSEWIWSSRNSGDESIGQYAFFARIAYNSRITEAYNYSKCISKELYNRIPLTDIRRRLFLNPEGYSYNSSTGLASKDLAAYARTLYADIYDKSPVYAYMQFKFKASDNTGAGDVNHIRTAEMYLIEAEADYYLHDEKGACEALIALTKDSGRDPEYTCSKTERELLEEIKLYRAIELWGEGFDWFDMKRWGDTIERKTFDKGGNFTAKTGFTTRPDENNGWCWLIPELETDYNPEI